MPARLRTGLAVRRFATTASGRVMHFRQRLGVEGAWKDALNGLTAHPGRQDAAPLKYDPA
uniref:Uncharacterized protein n=1 Tax=Ralstonia solanacearum CFBP2957 TaxID=859656 RepID=D8P3M7_RALSL|nr:protein of unknown function [Ralstonia solanacearum CFBP2957]